MSDARPALSSFITLDNYPQVVPAGAGAILQQAGPDRAVRLDAIGWRVWCLLPLAYDIGDLCGRLAEEFAASPAEIAAGVLPLLGQLADVGMIGIHPSEGGAAELRRRYLDLLKRALLNLIYPEHELRIHHLERHGAGADRLEHERHLRDIRYRQPERYAQIVATRGEGQSIDKPIVRFAHSMVGMRRLSNLQQCAARVFADGVPGDFLEAGVCQGGAAIFMRALQVAYGEPGRRLWAADSFAGLPPATATADLATQIDLTEPQQPWLAFSQAAVRDNFRTYGMLDANVRFLPGWFCDSLPGAPVERLAILRLDGDLYSSTREALGALYDRVSPGGFIIVDDYQVFPACRQAVDEFRAERAIDGPIWRIDEEGVYWRKGL
jgi:hypothetical protein